MMDILPWLGFGALGAFLILGLIKGKREDHGGGFRGSGGFWSGGGGGGCGCKGGFTIRTKNLLVIW